MRQHYAGGMDQEPYMPDLDDADFRRLIDARHLVLIRFWQPGSTDPNDDEFPLAAIRHPEVAFAQSNVEEHHNLMLRTQASNIPTLQGWIDGNLFGAISGHSNGTEIDDFIQKMQAHRHGNHRIDTAS